MGQWPPLLDLLALGALIAVAVGMACRLPLVSFGIGWFLLQLLPTSLIPRADLSANATSTWRRSGCCWRLLYSLSRLPDR